jgi:hypothetical protein
MRQHVVNKGENSRFHSPVLILTGRKPSALEPTRLTAMVT